MVSSTSSSTCQLLLVDALSPKQVNLRHSVSIYVQDLLMALEKELGTGKILPICETLAQNEKVPMHVVCDPKLQRLFEQYHRYGPSTKDPQVKCPFQDNSIRKRFSAVIPQPNILIQYEGENKTLRHAMQTFFSKKNLNELQEVWTPIIDSWIDKLPKNGPIKLFESVIHLLGRLTIEGTLGYNACTDADVQTSTQFWLSLFNPFPSELRHVDEPINSYLAKIQDIPEFAKKIKLMLVNRRGLGELVRRIVDYGTSPDGRLRLNFPAYLTDEGFNRETVEGTITLTLVAQETANYLLGYILYEYARNLDLQKKHRVENEGCHRMFLEALRMYSTGGAMREAGSDMIVSYLQDEQIVEHYIRKGDLINCNPTLAGRNSEFWPNPEEFNPDRDNLNEVRKLVVPFGSGAHSCVGETAAERVILVALAKILSRVELSNSEPLPSLLNLTTTRPERDITVDVKKG